MKASNKNPVAPTRPNERSHLNRISSITRGFEPENLNLIDLLSEPLIGTVAPWHGRTLPGFPIIYIDALFFDEEMRMDFDFSISERNPSPGGTPAQNASDEMFRWN